MRDYSLVPDAHNLMESTRSIGYSLPAAVADLIDNSIAAHATEVQINTPTQGRQVLSILDDGFGMSEAELLVAMKYGSRPIDERREDLDLGRFGLGLKMASLSQCRRLKVISKKDGRICGACWDLDYVASSQENWPLQILEEEDLVSVPCIEFLEKNAFGTLVVWENLDILMQGIEKGTKSAINVLAERIADLKKNLALVFHRYLEGKDGPALRICFNQQILSPMDPFLVGVSTQPFAEDVFILNGEEIRYQPYILPHPKHMTQEQRDLAGDLQRDQGFYLYRNRRLIIWGTWFRLSRKLVLSKLARVRVDIPASAELDKIWSLDVKKSSAFIPEELRESLRSVVERLGEKSSNVWRKRARKEQVNEEAFWKRASKDGVAFYVINEENPAIKNLYAKCPEAKKVVQLIASRLPLDSLYLDLANEIPVDVPRENLKQEKNTLKKQAFD